MFSHVPEREREREWSARLIWDVAPALLEHTAQQGRLVVPAATEKAKRNFLKPQVVPAGSAQQELWLGRASPKKDVFLDFQKQGVRQLSHEVKCLQIVQIRKEASPRVIIIEQPVFCFVNCSVPLIANSSALRR